jgi:putative MATE family efflux protein
VCGLLTLVVGSMLAPGYMRLVATDEATIEAGTIYLLWFMPALALQFALLVMAAALRGTGIVRPTMIVQAVALLINIVLAPVLIAGWGTGRGFGVAGAGLASSIAVLFGVVMMWVYFHKLERYVGVNRKQCRPEFKQWKRILNIGLPAGGEFAIMFIYLAVIYYALRDFGAAAQAGFGIGSRVLGLIQVPAMAIAFAAGPIAGQNFGAGNGERVKETFRKVALIGTAVMIGFTIFAQWQPGLLLGGFPKDTETMAVGVLFLQMVSLNLVAQGLIFDCSSMFQGLGNTKPVLLSSGVRLVTYAMPVMWLSARPEFRIEHVWYVSIVTTTLQAALSLWLLRLEFRKRLVAFVR